MILIRFLLLLITCAVPFLTNSKPVNQWAFSNIPSALLKDADAVIRFDSTEMKIEGEESVILKKRYAITILKEEAQNLGNVVEWYNTQSKINTIHFAYYDKDGKLIKSVKDKEMLDRSTFGLDYTFHSDRRLKVYNFSNPTYPYTLVFEMEKTFQDIFDIDDWQPQIQPNYSLETAYFKITYPESLNLRRKQYLIPNSMVLSSIIVKGIVTKTWQVENLTAVESEPASTTGDLNTPTLKFGPSQFTFMGHKGSLDTWSNFGMFYYNLNKGRDVLPAEVKKKVHELTKGQTTTIQKVQALYEEMQQNTRYVADEFGISGWQTFDATYVCTKGYGDCKGLTNYLKSLLKEAGITSYVTIISAGDNQVIVDPEFPANYFNHVILCVPNNKDTIWVECTSATYKAGYLGEFTQDRYAVLCTEKGGFLVRTPEYGKGKTFLHKNAKLIYNQNTDEQNIELENTYSGLFQDNLYELLKSKDNVLLTKVNNKKFPFPSYSVKLYDAQFAGTYSLPQVIEKATIKASGLIHRANEKTIVNLGWLENPMLKISQMPPRIAPIILKKSFSVKDSIYLYYPKPEFNLLSLPAKQELKYPFAQVQMQYHEGKDYLLIVREFEQTAGTYPAATFADYQKMYALLNGQNAELNVVLERKNED